MCGARANVRFGSKADVRAAKSHVRFTPESGHVQCSSRCPLRAKSGHDQKNAKSTCSWATGHLTIFRLSILVVSLPGRRNSKRNAKSEKS